MAKLTCTETFTSGGSRLHTIHNVSDIYPDVVKKLEAADLSHEAFFQIMSNAVNPTAMFMERITEKFDHYIADISRDRNDNNDLEVNILFKEIAGLDPELCREVRNKILDIGNDLRKVYKLQSIIIAKDKNGDPCMKFVYKTERRPQDPDYSSYDEETGLRTTWSGGHSESYIRQIASFLSGEFNVPITDELV